jgi:threonine synthase
MEKIFFHSTNGQAPEVDLRQAMLQGQAPDRGLYMPNTIPALSGEEIAAFAGMEYAEIAFDVLRRYTDGVMDPETLRALCEDAYDFEVPVEVVYDRISVMRLDRGPTASFKDFAARMMARMIAWFLKENGNGGRRLTILTATSGDTGSAVASAFHGLEGIGVVVLFPIAEVSERQRKQMTTLGGNVRAIAVDGKFDDCQAMVKRAFSDPELGGLSLSSANSINIGRLLPQAVYYFYAASRVAEPGEATVMCVPSGNFGNMMGCALATRMGLGVKRLAVPVNANDEFPRFLETGEYRKVEPSRACLSNAMNVGHPSNLARLVELYGGWMDETGEIHRAAEMGAMRRDLFSSAVSDARTRQTLREAWEDHRLLLEPHGAVAWRGLEDYIGPEPLEGAPAVVVETAHPAKFPEEIEKLLGFSPELPASLASLEGMAESGETMESDYEVLKRFLLG